MPEIPAGMVDERTGQFKFVATEEMREETGLVINSAELVDLTELAYGDRFRGMIPSAGGCDETCRLFLYRRQVTPADLVSLQVCPPDLKVRTPAHTKQLGWYVEFESRVTQDPAFALCFHCVRD